MAGSNLSVIQSCQKWFQNKKYHPALQNRANPAIVVVVVTVIAIVVVIVIVFVVNVYK